MRHATHSLGVRRPGRAAWFTFVAAALGAAALPAPAQAQPAGNGPRFAISPEAGAFLPTGNAGQMFAKAAMVGGQLQWSLTHRWAVVAGYSFSPSRDRTTSVISNSLYTGEHSPLNVSQGDVGVRATFGRPSRDGWGLRPYVGIGGGVRRFAYTDKQNVMLLVGKSSANAGLEYGAVGLQLTNPDEPVGLQLQARDDVTQFKGTYGELASATTQNDVMLSAGVAFRF